MNQSVAEIDRMTQQNAALVEESAAAAESLREQAARLSQGCSSSVWLTHGLCGHGNFSAPAPQGLSAPNRHHRALLGEPLPRNKPQSPRLGALFFGGL